MVGLHMPKQSFISMHLLGKDWSGPTNMSDSCVLDAPFSHLSSRQTIYADNQICYSMLGYLIAYKM